MNAFFDNIWVKRFLAVLAGVVVLLLTQYGKTGMVDPQALALHVADAIDKMIVAGALGAVLVAQPNVMRRPRSQREPPA